jgi:hypothetical protein
MPPKVRDSLSQGSKCPMHGDMYDDDEEEYGNVGLAFGSGFFW